MLRYKIVLSRRSKKQLDKLPDNIAAPILESISLLETIPRPIGCKKLKGRDGYRIRVGDYRVIYQIIDDELIIDVVTVGHRREIYQ